MIIIKCKINKEYICDLLEWDVQAFNINPCLKIEIADLSDIERIKAVFDDLDSIEIYFNDNLIGSYYQYDGYLNFEYSASEYDENRGAFFDVVKIYLTQKNIVDKVNELDRIVNKIVDINSMTVSEYKDYITSVFSAQGQKDIFAGTNVTLGDGSTPLFTCDFEDQLNLLSALQMITFVDDAKILIPYHSHHRLYTMYTGLDIVRIYIGLMTNLIQIRTRVNTLNNWVRSLNDKNKLLEIKYDSELPNEYKQQYEAIISSSLQMLESIKKRFFPLD